MQQPSAGLAAMQGYSPAPVVPTDAGLSPLAGLADILAGSAATPAKMLGSAGLMHVKGVSPAGKATAPQGIDPSLYTQLASLLTGGR